MERFDPRASFGYEVSDRLDTMDTRSDAEETVAFLGDRTKQG